MKTQFLLFIGLLLSSYLGFSQIIINEYSCSNRAGITDSFGEREDWVEFYNTSAAAIDLTGYYLSDRENNLTKWQITSGSIPANGYLLVYFSGRGLVTGGGEIHPNFTLSQTQNEWIVLASPTGNVVDSLKMVKMTQLEHSYGRTTDASANWSLFTTPTPGAANTGAVEYYTATPVFSVQAGFYGGAQNVTITTTDASATIYYTLDGTEPTTGSTVYSGPINIASTTVLRARCFSSTPNTPPSFIETNTYFINESHTMPVLSVCGTQITAFLNNTAPGSFSQNFVGHFEFFETDGTFIDEGLGHYNKHGNDSWAYAQRGFDFVMRDGMGYNHAIEHQIFPGKNRDVYQRIMAKPAANDNYSFEDGAHLRDAYVHTLSQLGELRLDERTSRFVVVYVDGVYWGLYDIREKIDDHDFTKIYYEQGKFDIDFIKTWGATWAEYGTMDDWDDLYAYIIANDMSIDANYEYVAERYNVESLIDYTVLNSYIVSADWLNWNTAWWRGRNPEGDKKKWRYVLWDMDASFGHYINYTGVPDTGPNADPCNPEGLTGGSDPQGHMTILNKLLENENFQQQYITRYADLSNGIFSCEQMIHVLDSFVTVMTPEMPDQIARWGVGSMAGWEANIQTLKDFIDERCATISTGMIDCYDLTGPFDLTVDVQPAGAGRVKVNSEWVPYYDWTGVYYGNINTILKADAYAGYEFDYWSCNNHVFMDINTVDDTLDLSSSDTIVAHFKVIEEDNPDYPDLPNPVGDFTGFHVPNAFSPNGDGNNDLLYLFVGYDVVSFKFYLSDRWGNLIFETESIGDFWDGSYKGKAVNSGVFSYVATYQLTTGEVVKTSGNITLIR